MILKWVGGKKQLSKKLFEKIKKEKFLNSEYLEPFCGGAALFWTLKKNSMFKDYHLNDLNDNLINFYKTTRDDPTSLKKEIFSIQKKFENSKDKNSFFLNLRKYFNLNKSNLNCEQAATFYSLNKLCFNGMYRENKSGQFNVPFGKKEKLSFDEKTFDETSLLLQNVFLTSFSYEKLNFDNKFIYLDPPYLQISETSKFTTYTKDGFNQEDQAKLCEKLKQSKNSKWILSNSKPDNDYFENLYNGMIIEYPLMSRNINCKKEKRGKIKEILISNFL